MDAYFAPDVLPASPTAPPLRQRAAAHLPGPRAVILLVAIVSAAAVGLAMRSGGAARPNATLRLPTVLAGQPAMVGASDFGARSNGWAAAEGPGFGGKDYIGRGYGSATAAQPLVRLNVVVVAGDARTEGDLSYAGSVRQRFGDVECANTTLLGGGTDEPSDRDGICWRGSSTLTVSALHLGRGTQQMAADAVQEAWDANS